MIDSHAHLTSDKLYPDIEALLERAKEKKVQNIINICTDPKTLERGLELSEKYPWVFNAGSTTPHDVDKEGEKYFSHFKEAAENKKLVAIGETGLDYYYEHSSKKNQRDFFIRYIKLAISLDLPLIIHCRDAFDDFFDIIDEYYPHKRKGVLHCFTGTVKEAEKLIEREWYLSFSGIITFKKSEELREAVKITPIDQILIETDSPYLAPQSKRGKVNEPSFIEEIAHMVTELKKISLKETLETTSSNTKNLFNLHE